MRKFTIFFLTLGVVIIFLSCTASEKTLSEPEGELLSQSDLEHFFKDTQTCKYKIYDGRSYGTLTNFSDKTVEKNWNMPGGFAGTEIGTYSIENGQYCRDYKGTGSFPMIVGSNTKECYQVFRIGDNEYKYIPEDRAEHVMYLSYE